MSVSVHRSYPGACAVTRASILLTEGSLANRPPAFQFYAKDWRSSSTVSRMTHEQRGIYISIMALAWDSEEPGTINMTEAQLCRELRIFSATLRRLLADFPTTLRKVDGKFVQTKLAEQWAKYKEISEKRSQAASKCSANAQQTTPSAFAVASASASAQSKDRPGSSHTDFYFRNRKQEE